MKSRFQLRNLYSRIHIHFDRPGRRREKLAEALQELKVRREKRETELTIHGLAVVQV